MLFTFPVGNLINGSHKTYQQHIGRTKKKSAEFDQKRRQVPMAVSYSLTSHIINYIKISPWLGLNEFTFFLL